MPGRTRNDGSRLRGDDEAEVVRNKGTESEPSAVLPSPETALRFCPLPEGELMQ